MRRTKAEARLAGYVLTPFGRRCWIPGIADRNPARRGYAERQAINAPLQGGAADIIKRAMIRLPDALRDAGLTAHMLLQVHDELLFEAPEDQAEAATKLARTVMEAAQRSPCRWWWKPASGGAGRRRIEAGGRQSEAHTR